MEIGISPSAAEFYYDANAPMIFSTNASERMRITSGGAIVYRGESNVNSQVFLSNDNSLFRLYAGDSSASTKGFAFFVTNGSNQFEAMRITSGGNVGIGTTSPSERLTVSGNVLATQLIIRNSGVPAAQFFRDLDVTVVGPAGQGIEFGARSGSTYIAGAAIYGGLDNPATTGTLVFQTLNGGSLGTRLTIASSGAATFSSSVTAGGNIQSNRALVATGPNADWTGLGIFADIDGTFGRLGVYNYSTFSWGALSINNGSIYSSGNNGNVGIGTTSPDSRLHLGINVNQSIKVNSANANAAFLGIFNDAAALTVNRDPATGNIQDATKATSAVYVRGEVSNGYITFETTATNNVNSTERMRITSGGNVGIGTTSPAERLDVRGRVFINGTDTRIYIDNGGVGGSSLLLGVVGTSHGYIGTDGPFPIIFQPNNTERMRIDALGNVGIGTTTINVGGWGKAVTLRGSSNAAYEVTDGTVRLATFVAGSSIGGISVETNHPLGLYTNSTERMRITSGGNLLLGTTSDNGARLQVSGAATFSAGGPTTSSIEIGSSDNATISSRESMNFQVNNTGTVANRSFAFRNGGKGYSDGTLLFEIASSGAATFSNSVTATAFFASSDIRLKDIIAHDGDVITYKWKDGRDDKIHYGYSAQNLQSINPNLVNKNDDGFLSVNYTETLVLKVRELEKEVQLLKAQIN
jgi:hypothetical protein